MREEDLTVHDSCGNVFADMGVPNAEQRLAWAVRNGALTAGEAAELLGLPVSDVPEVMGAGFGQR